MVHGMRRIARGSVVWVVLLGGTIGVGCEPPAWKVPKPGPGTQGKLPDDLSLPSATSPTVQAQRKAAEGGSAEAMAGLAYRYETGQGVKQNYAQND